MRRFVLAVAVAAASASGLTHADDDWGVKRDPFDKAVIARYKAILAASPHDASALAKLLELYRRYRTVDQLKDEYGKLLDAHGAAASQWAALVVLGRLHHATGDDVRALDQFQRAVAARDDDAPSWLLIGELQRGASRPADARAAYDKALAHASAKDMKKKALRALADLALATGDNAGADGYFQQFLALDPSNAQLWIERGDAMLAAGKRDVALDSYAAAEKLLSADPARRVEVVARRGQALEGLGKDDDAVAEYRRAIKLAPKGYYLEVELTGRIIDLYRRKQALPQLLAQFEKEWSEGGRGHFEWSTLGKLYEEVGAQDKAIAALKKAVARSPWELETQRRLIQLLENSGRDDEALAQYEAVVRAAPGEARFQLELAERYWRRGQEKKALDALTRLEARFPNDSGVLGAIADTYQRWGKEELAIAEYERLARLEPDDPTHLITLGEQYWQKGDHHTANLVWKRIIASGKPAAYAKLAEVEAEHANFTEAIDLYNHAIKGDDKNAEFFRGRASVFEAQHQAAQALADWDRVLALLGTQPANKLARRDARRHYINVLGSVPTPLGARRSPSQTKHDDWQRTFAAASPPADAAALEAGYMLVEFYSNKKNTTADQPMIVLERLTKLAPDDQDVMADLAKAYRQNHRYDEAVALLLKLAQVAPSREREVYQQISEIRSETRRDSEAIEWAQKAVAKSPTDPSGYERLAERYVEMQQLPEAIAAYDKTVHLDPRNSKAAFALAELYVQTGLPDKANELYRSILRTANDEEVLGRAGEKAIWLAEMTESLGELEKVMSPLSFMMAHKPIYRRVLVELYQRYVPQLVDRERHGDDAVRAAARAELERIGAHGLRPLLEALRDDKDPPQQRIAVAVLGHLHNKGAAEALVHMARVEPPRDPRRIPAFGEATDSHELRIDAMIAAGRLGESTQAEVLDDVLALYDEHQDASMREAALFTLGRSQDRRALPALMHAIGERPPQLQVLGCLGLAEQNDPKVTPVLLGVVKEAGRSDAIRAACAYALGVRRAAPALPVLLATIDDNRGDAQRIAAWALGQIGDPHALGPLLRAYFARSGSASDELVWAIGRVAGVAGTPALATDRGDYPVKGDRFAEVAAVRLLPGPLPHPTLPARVIADHASDIAAGLQQALGEHRDVVVSALGDLDGSADRIALGALTEGGTADAKLDPAIATIAAAIAPQVTSLAIADDPKVRALAISVLAKIDRTPDATNAVLVRALADSTLQVRTAAMHAIEVVIRRRGVAAPALVSALVGALRSASRDDRRAAALTLGALGPVADVDALAGASHDAYSLVREAVAIALGQVGTPAALRALEPLTHDEVAQVREAAQRGLTKRGAGTP